MLAVTVLFAGLPLSPAQGAPDSLYGPDPQHLWNRLHSALTPPAPARQTGISEILDPLVQPLLPEGDANREAVALLEEFAAGGPKPEVMSALQRALMQRDLLALFHQVSAASLNSEWNGPEGMGRFSTKAGGGAGASHPPCGADGGGNPRAAGQLGRRGKGSRSGDRI